jgi:hypothetical protein
MKKIINSLLFVGLLSVLTFQIATPLTQFQAQPQFGPGGGVPVPIGR